MRRIIDGAIVAKVRCLKCGKTVFLPQVAVRLKGVLCCGCGCLFEYPCFKFYNRDGSLRPGYIAYNRAVAKKDVQ